jgi:ParB-like chromosome segregation protein Spo0J
MIEKIKIGEIKPNPNNPRVIRDDKFKKLVKSIKDFPQMLAIRPIVIDEDGIVLGGNMRLKACKEAGLVEVPVIKAENLTEAQKKEFIIKDNANFGDWDWALINSDDEWEAHLLEDWGVDYFQLPSEADYSILDEGDDGEGDDVNDKLDDLKSGVRKAIQIEFEPDDYIKATELVKHFREAGHYVGGMLIDYLTIEKSK